MTCKSTPEQYGRVAVALHWIGALLVLSALVAGFRAADFPDPASKAALLRIHVVAGLATAVLTAVRAAWWLIDRRPDPPPRMARLEARLALGVHLVIYILIFAMAASGLATLVLSGGWPALFGTAAVDLPDFRPYTPRVLHGLGAQVLSLLLLFHVGAALYHHLIRRDRLMRRMWFGAIGNQAPERPVGTSSPDSRSTLRRQGGSR